MENKLFGIQEICVMTGFTDRTIRNYISCGLLKGEIIGGMWQFSTESLEAFMQNPDVLSRIQSKNRSIVYDFLADDYKKQDEACIILDFSIEKRKELMEKMTDRICSGGFHDIRFSYDASGRTARIILKGPQSDVLSIVNECLQS